YPVTASVARPLPAPCTLTGPRRRRCLLSPTGGTGGSTPNPHLGATSSPEGGPTQGLSTGVRGECATCPHSETEEEHAHTVPGGHNAGPPGACGGLGPARRAGPQVPLSRWPPGGRRSA